MSDEILDKFYSSKIYTHKEIVALAKHWLSSAKGCNPVFTEKGSSKTSEMPDVIGWNSNDCIVVECKTSVGDFKADSKKVFRHTGGMGSLRYYFMPYDLYEKIKNETTFLGFGIVCVNLSGRMGQVRLKNSDKFERNYQAECYFLRSRIMEIQQFGR